MRSTCLSLVGAAALLVVVGHPSTLAGQTAAGRQPLIGTWKLITFERGDSAQSLSAVANPRGILIQDAAGNVIEIVTRGGRTARTSGPATAQDDLESFMNYNAFWGTYTVDNGRPTVTYRINGDLNPNRIGQQSVRSYERNGIRLTVTESAPNGGPVRRLTWERLPELEAFPPYLQDVVGFWGWVSAGRLNSSGVEVRPTHRDPSVIVYTPTGHMAVIYLGTNRGKIAGSNPTADEARAAMQELASYFGTYIVQPKSGYVTHYQLGSPNAGGAGGSQMRYFEVKGSELILRFPPEMLNGQEVRNIVHLKRLGGLKDMWPDFSPSR
jgi:hypothetical protein